MEDLPEEDIPEEDIPEEEPEEPELEGVVVPEPELLSLEGEAEDVKLVTPLEKKYPDYYKTPNKFVAEVVKALNRMNKDSNYRVKQDDLLLHNKPPGELVALLQKYSPKVLERIRWKTGSPKKSY